MDIELMSSHCVNAGEGFFVAQASLRDPQDPVRACDMEQVLAWRVDVFSVPGEIVPISTISPVTINGCFDSADYILLRPDGEVERPDSGSPIARRTSHLHLVHSRA